VITGLRNVTGGQILLGGYDITNKNPRQAIDLGLSHVPEDRSHTGLIGSMGVSDNLILKGYRRRPLSRLGFLIKSATERFTDRLIKEFEIATPSRDTQVRTLSGGNLQKVILAREITAGDATPTHGRGSVMVAVHPTRGLDIGATEWVQRTLLEERLKGAAILLISEDLDELLAVSDRIAVIFEGSIMDIVPAQAADVEELGLMMAGTAVKQKDTA
jgi:simple sugar transport system ATP-binding protein